MSKSNNKKKIIICLFLCILLVVLLIGFSFLLFTEKSESNRKKEYMELNTKSIKGIIYDYTNPLILENAIPGDSILSSISIYNPNKKLTASYEIRLIVDKNTFTKTDGERQLILKIKSLKTNEEKEIDLTDNESIKQVNLFTIKGLEPQKSDTYEITLDFLETNYPQDNNKGKTFIGHIEMIQSFEIFDGQ